MPEVEIKFNDEGYIDTCILRKIKLTDPNINAYILKIKNLTNKYNNVLSCENRGFQS